MALLIGVPGWSQEPPKPLWEKAASGGLNITQTSFENWSSGGENAYAWQLILSYRFIQNKEKTTWSNTGKLAYGTSKMGEGEVRKSVDEIKMESVLTYKLERKVNPFVAITGETQLAAGYDYALEPAVQISAFMDPGYFRESLGGGYDNGKGLATRLGLSFKQTVANDYARHYADDPATVEIEKLRSEIGFESVSDLLLALSEIASYTSKLELFSTLGAFDEIDVRWDNTVAVKVTEYINININLKLVYDKDISVKRQLMQTMAIGLNYTFI